MGMNKNSLLELINTFEVANDDDKNNLLYHIVCKILNEDLSDNDYTILYNSHNYFLNTIAIKIIPRHLLLNNALEETDDSRANIIIDILGSELTVSEADTLLMAKNINIVKYAIKKASIEKIIIISKNILSSLPCIYIRKEIYDKYNRYITSVITKRILNDIYKDNFEFTTDDANFYLSCKESSLSELAVKNASIEKIIKVLQCEKNRNIVDKILNRLESENYETSFNENIMLSKSNFLNVRKFAIKRLPTNILIKLLETDEDKYDIYFIFDQLKIRKYIFSKDDISSLLHANLPLVRIEIINLEDSVNTLNELLIFEKDKEVIAHIKYRIYSLTSKIDSKDDIIKLLLEEGNLYLANLLLNELKYDFDAEDANILINAKSPYIRDQHMYKVSTPNLIKRLEVEEKEYLLNKTSFYNANNIINSILSQLQYRKYLFSEEETKLFINSSFDEIRAYAICNASKSILLNRLKIEKNDKLTKQIIAKLFNI